MAQVLRIDSEGKPFSSMNMIVCKTAEEAEEVFSDKRENLKNPKELAENAVWGERFLVHDAFGHTFIGRRDNLVFEIILYEGAGPASTEDLTRMHQKYLSEKRELDILISRIMKLDV